MHPTGDTAPGNHGTLAADAHAERPEVREHLCVQPLALFDRTWYTDN
jgi:hypothetical protein